MSAEVKINDSALNRKLAQFAILSQKGLEEALREGGKRFVSMAVRNTMPMILTQSPAATRRQWQERITKHYETHRVTKDGYRKYSVVRKIISAKKKKLGREAAGWNAAAQALNATRIPAWVARHGTSEGSCSFIKTRQHLVLTLRNSVPYNERMTRERAEFALRKVTQGFDNNLRVLKKKLLRQIRK